MKICVLHTYGSTQVGSQTIGCYSRSYNKGITLTLKTDNDDGVADFN